MLDVRPIEEVSKVGAAACCMSRDCMTRHIHEKCHAVCLARLASALASMHTTLSWQLQLPQIRARSCAAPSRQYAVAAALHALNNKHSTLSQHCALRPVRSAIGGLSA